MAGGKEKGAGLAGEGERKSFQLVKPLVPLNSTVTSCDHRYMICVCI